MMTREKIPGQRTSSPAPAPPGPRSKNSLHQTAKQVTRLAGGLFVLIMIQRSFHHVGMMTMDSIPGQRMCFQK